MESVRQSAALAEVAAAPPESCSVKSCAIEGVESLHPDLEPHVLANVNCFLSPRSTFSIPCEFRSSKYRGALPGCWSPGSAKQDELNTLMAPGSELPFRRAAAASLKLTPVPGVLQVRLGL